MTVTKKELEVINRRLQETISLLTQENEALHHTNRELRQRLTAYDAHLTRLGKQYRTLSDYIRTLHSWLNAHRNKTQH